MEFTTPANCLTFNLQRAARALARRMDAALGPVGLSAQQFSVLALLASRGAMPTTRLAEAVGTERTTITRNLAVLRRKGLVAPADTGDARVRAIALTEKGCEKVAAAMPLWTEAQQGAVDLVGRETAERLLTTLRHI